MHVIPVVPLTMAFSRAGMTNIVMKQWTMLVAVALSLSLESVHGGLQDFMDHVNAPGTQLGRPDDDPDFYTSHSRLPHLPKMDGFMGSHGNLLR